MRSNNKHKFYVFEGDNGVGKTTLLNRILQEIPGIKTNTPTNGYKPIRDYIHQRDSNMAKFLYYVSSVFDSSIDIKEALKHSPVFCDRYIGSSIVDFLIRRNIDFTQIMDFYNFIKKDLLMPDHTFLLKCVHDERIKRVAQKIGGGSVFDDTSKDYSEKTDLFYNQFVLNEPNWHVFDTTNCSVDNLFIKVKEVIKEDDT